MIKMLWFTQTKSYDENVWYTLEKMYLKINLLINCNIFNLT